MSLFYKKNTSWIIMTTLILYGILSKNFEHHSVLFGEGVVSKCPSGF